jgi:hypothetical protein
VPTSIVFTVLALTRWRIITCALQIGQAVTPDSIIDKHRLHWVGNKALQFGQYFVFAVSIKLQIGQSKYKFWLQPGHIFISSSVS